MTRLTKRDFLTGSNLSPSSFERGTESQEIPGLDIPVTNHGLFPDGVKALPVSLMARYGKQSK
jgi:hypothetical protein